MTKCRRMKTCCYRHEINQNVLIEHLNLQILELNKHVEGLTKVVEEKDNEIKKIKHEVNEIKDQIKSKDEEIFWLHKDKIVIINERNKIQKENVEMKEYKTKSTLENATTVNNLEKLKEINENIKKDLKYNIKAKKLKEKELKRALLGLDWSEIRADKRAKDYSKLDLNSSSDPDESIEESDTLSKN